MEFESLKSLRLHGFPKFLHWLFMLITYPLRHPFKFLLILALLIVLAFVFFNEDNPSLLKKIEPKKDTVFKETPVADAKTAPKKFGKKFALKHAEPEVRENKENSKESEIVSENREEPKYQVWNIQNKEQAEDIDVQKEPQEKSKLPAEIENLVAKEEIQKPSVDTAFVQKGCLNCVMLEKPETISGQAIVYGPTELYVADTYLYLNGIETDPLKYNIEKAKIYLRELINSEEIKCEIIAKTPENIASAICFKGEQNINKSMVEAGFADRVTF